MYFDYDDKVIEHLKKRDKKLAQVIDTVGKIERAVHNDIFTAIIFHIIGQQISTVAQKTICNRLSEKLGTIDAENILKLSDDELQQIGISFRKVSYIKQFAEKVASDELNLEALNSMSDEDVIKTLSSLNGIGVWTAEMLLIFTMQRPNVLSYGDLAIIRGLRMLYRHKKIDRTLFNKYMKRYSPYCSVASLYLWAIAGGAIPELTDPAQKKKVK